MPTLTVTADDEYAGRLHEGQSVGDSIFGDNNDDGRILATIIAGPEGCTTASISLHSWRVAHSQVTLQLNALRRTIL